MPSRSYKRNQFRGIPGEHGHPPHAHYLPFLSWPHVPLYSAMHDFEQIPLLPLHHLLRRTGRIIWDVRFHPSISRHPGSKEHMASPTSVRISATEPRTRRMRIIFDHFKWEIEVFPNGRDCVFVEDVLLEIYHFLQEPLPKVEWYKVGRIMQRPRMHARRCERLIDGPVEYELDSRIKMIDVLDRYTVFGGLTQLGSMEWLLTLQERMDRS